MKNGAGNGRGEKGAVVELWQTPKIREILSTSWTRKRCGNRLFNRRRLERVQDLLVQATLCSSTSCGSSNTMIATQYSHNFPYQRSSKIVFHFDQRTSHIPKLLRKIEQNSSLQYVLVKPPEKRILKVTGSTEPNIRESYLKA